MTAKVSYRCDGSCSCLVIDLDPLPAAPAPLAVQGVTGEPVREITWVRERDGACTCGTVNELRVSCQLPAAEPWHISVSRKHLPLSHSHTHTQGHHVTTLAPSGREEGRVHGARVVTSQPVNVTH